MSATVKSTKGHRVYTVIKICYVYNNDNFASVLNASLVFTILRAVS